MGNIEITSLRDINNKLKSFPINKLIFWVGSGIDSNDPTSLPLGNELTDLILKLSCGDKFITFQNIWKDNSEYISDITNHEVIISNIPRLETIIEAIREFEDHQLKKESIISGLKTFSSSYFYPNHEHYILAYLLNQGANIVTTNYGDFICSAFREQFGNNKIHHVKNDLHIYKTENAWESSVFHIHGISEDLNTIGANLSNVKNRLPKSFIDKFEYWINNDFCFIFLGYSGLDTLDVNPLFKSQMKNQNNSLGIYVRHSQLFDKSFNNISNNEKTLLYPFKFKYICPCVTGEFLNSFKKCDCMVNNDVNKTSWKEIFRRHSKAYSYEYSNAFLLGLCYRLGLNITSFFSTEEWVNKTTNTENIDSWYKNYYAFENATIIGDSITIENKGKYLKSKNDTLAELDYYYSYGNIEKVIEKSCSIIDLRIQIENCFKLNKVIDWNISTQLNRHVDYLINKLLDNKGDLVESINILQQMNVLDNLIECFEYIIQEGYDAVLEVNQINTAYRSLALCQALKNLIKKSLINLKIALDNYADISSINGVVLTELNTSLVLIIDYCLNLNPKSLEKADTKLITSQKLINKLGLFRYKNKCTKIRNLYNYVFNNMHM